MKSDFYFRKQPGGVEPIPRGYCDRCLHYKLIDDIHGVCNDIFADEYQQHVTAAHWCRYWRKGKKENMRGTETKPFSNFAEEWEEVTKGLLRRGGSKSEKR